MKKYRCTICGYVYDPAIGDPDGGIAPGTPFEQIPDDWVCPVCGASKEDFEPIEQLVGIDNKGLARPDIIRIKVVPFFQLIYRDSISF